MIHPDVHTREVLVTALGRNPASYCPDKCVLQCPRAEKKEWPTRVAVAGPVLRGLIAGAKDMRLVEVRQIILNRFEDCTAGVLVRVVAVSLRR